MEFDPYASESTPLSAPVAPPETQEEAAERVARLLSAAQTSAGASQRTDHVLDEKLNTGLLRGSLDLASFRLADPAPRKKVVEQARPRLPVSKSSKAGVLPAGAFLLPALPGSGKTTGMSALYCALLSLGYPTDYLPIMEPRGEVVVGGDQRKKLGTVEVIPYIEALKESYDRAVRQAAAAGEWANARPLVIVDSATFTLRMLPETVTLMESEDSSTYEGGLDSALVAGALHHQLRAEAWDVSLLLVLNSELLPVSERLKGAAEGIVRYSSGQLSVNAREWGRRDVFFDLTPFVDLAREALRIRATSGSPTRGGFVS